MLGFKGLNRLLQDLKKGTIIENAFCEEYGFNFNESLDVEIKASEKRCKENAISIRERIEMKHSDEMEEIL